MFWVHKTLLHNLQIIFRDWFQQVTWMNLECVFWELCTASHSVFATSVGRLCTNTSVHTWMVWGGVPCQGCPILEWVPVVTFVILGLCQTVKSPPFSIRCWFFYLYVQAKPSNWGRCVKSFLSHLSVWVGLLTFWTHGKYFCAVFSSIFLSFLYG